MSSTRKRYPALILALLMALGAPTTAVPAAAADPADAATASAASGVESAVVLFRGRAEVGDDWDHGQCLGNSGLNYPQLSDANAGEVKCYRLEAPAVAPTTFCIYVGIIGGSTLLDVCEIEAEGTVKPLFPTPVTDAPFCGLSASNGGNGTFVPAGLPTVILLDLGWITSAGTWLPINGKWSSPGKPLNDFVALVSMSGSNAAGTSLAVACQTHKGADSFDVNSIAVLLPTNDLPAHPKKP